MEAMRLQVSDLVHLLPELTLVIAAVVLSVLDLLLPNRVNRKFIGWLTLVSLIISGVFVVLQLNPAESIELLANSYRVDDFASLMKLVFIVGTGFVVYMSFSYVKKDEIYHVGEYYYFMLPATLGAFVMASSADLITLYVGLELLSITSYIMVALRKKSQRSNEAAFKYLVMGAIASAIILYGMSFLYGISGSTNLVDIRAAIASNFHSYEMIVYIASFLLIAGLSFKIAAAPFHAWAPDVYEGAPTPVTSFLAVVSKAAAFAMIFRMIYVLFAVGTYQEVADAVMLALSVIAAAAMIIGNVTALRQHSFKRLLAYSGVANAGYLLVPITAHFSTAHFSNFSEFLYYLIAYLFMNIGAFAVLMILERSTGSDQISGFAGLYHRAPYTAGAMTLIVLSLAGFPITGGFFGKLYILLGAMETQHYWLAAIMLATTVIAYYYYFGIIRQMFMRSGDESETIKVPLTLGVTAWICAIIGVGLGFFPHVILNALEKIFSLTKDLLLLS
ncbi:NADH-quinone oxidoreductase subunit N [Paenibacillus albiflavus]|uniref:NADH-quinone oxidoreductase subunit N n=1 Tax=Paenibacillus albiflavus TaxID=2545760 RepID=A0A4R4EAB2_9BACL|nr:NADH-quinone oxidoreductase subunit N [Paenibacillus albiflavus]TCZ76804.1 NADH-quinone oxidoreductase subunit N [Paenibacillus albiflavus]